MPIHQKVLYGGTLAENTPPPDGLRSVIHVPGAFRGNPVKFGLTEDDLSRHLLLVGGTGCGKTNLFYHIVRQLKSKMTPQDVMLIFDTKGDFYSRFFADGDAVIGNSAQYRKQSERWSLFGEITADGRDAVSIIQNTQEICKSLFSELIEHSNNPFFPTAASGLLASVIIALIRDGAAPNNLDLKQFIESSDTDALRALIGKYPDLAPASAYIAGKTGAQTQGILSEMYALVREILTGVFADAGAFSMRRFIRNKGGRAVFIEYDLAIGEVLTPVYSLLFDLALKEALGRTASQGNVYLIADELKLLPNLRHLDDGINFGRSLGVKIMAGLQSIDQLKANYRNEKKAENAVSGFSSVIAFRQNDFATREYITKLMGQNLVAEEVPEKGAEYRWVQRSGNVVEDWDLTGLSVGDAIVSLPDSRPFLFHFDRFGG